MRVLGNNSARIDTERLLAESGWVRGLAQSLVGASEVDDVVQETWRVALERPPRLDDPTSNLRGWLTTVVRNLVHRSHRSERRRIEHAQRVQQELPLSEDDAHERVMLQRRLTDAVIELAEPYKSAIVLRYFDGLSAREIAANQAISYDAARQRLSRGLAMLRARLDREYDGARATWSALCLGLVRRKAAFASPIAVLGGIAVSLKTVSTVVAALVLASASWWWLRATSNGRTDTQAASAQPEPAGELTTREVGAVTDSDRRVVPTTSAGGEYVIDRDHDLHGQAVDASGAAVAGANIEVLRVEPGGDGSSYNNWDRTLVASQATDGSGRFAIPLPIGRPFDLDVTAAGFAVERLTSMYAGERLTVHMHLAAALCGVVSDTSDGVPVVGALVLLRQHADSRSVPGVAPMECRTDSLGRYRFEGLTAARMMLEIQSTAEAALDQEYRMIDVPEGRQIEVDIKVVSYSGDGVAMVRGRVVDATTKLPIVDAQILTSYSRTVRTGNDGEYVMPNVALAHSFRMTARALGYGAKTREFIPSSSESVPERVDFELRPNRRANGRVVDALGTPIAGARVVAMAIAEIRPSAWMIDRPYVLSADDGSFAIDTLSPDMQHVLVVKKDEFGTRVCSFPPNESQLARVEFGDITLPPMSTVRGRVVDESGRGVPDQHVVLRGGDVLATGAKPVLAHEQIDVLATLRVLEMATTRDAWTDDLGRFSYADLSSGTYRIRLDTRYGNSARLREEPARLFVAEGAIVDDVRIVLAAGLTIDGRVLDEHGGPMAKAWVSLQSDTALNPHGSTTVDTDDEGHFCASNLVEGTYELTVLPSIRNKMAAQRVNFAPKHLTGVKAGTHELEIRLDPTAWIRGRVLDTEGRAVGNARVEARMERLGTDTSEWTNSEGRFEFGVSAAEVVNLIIHPPETDVGRATTTLTDIAPSDEEILVRLPR